MKFSELGAMLPHEADTADNPLNGVTNRNRWLGELVDRLW